MNKSLLTAQKIRKSFGNKLVFDALDIEIEAGKKIALLGPSGCGKTVLIRCLLGLEKIDQGKIATNTNKLSLCMQSDSLLPWLSLLENLQAVSAKNSSYLLQQLQRVGLDTYAQHKPHQISGGMQQKLNLVRTFLPDPELVFWDEPFVHIDQAQKFELYSVMKNFLSEKSIASLLITHDIDEAFFLSEEVWILGRNPLKIVEKIPSPLAMEQNTLALRESASYRTIFQRVLAHLQKESEGYIR